MRRIYYKVLALAAIVPCLYAEAAGQNVWRFNADSCTSRALEANAAVKNADLEVQAAIEMKRSAVAKYFPSVSANVSAFLMHDYLLDISSSDVKDGNLSMNVYSEGKPIKDYIDEGLDKIAPVFDRFGVDIRQEINTFVSGLSYDASLQMIRQGVSASVIAVQPLKQIAGAINQVGLL